MDKTNKKHLLDDVETKINQGLFSEAFNALYHGLDSIRRHSSKKIGSSLLPNIVNMQ